MIDDNDYRTVQEFLQRDIKQSKDTQDLILDFLRKVGAGEIPKEINISYIYTPEEIAISTPCLVAYYEGRKSNV